MSEYEKCKAAGKKSMRRAWEGPTTFYGKTTPRTERYKRIYEKIYGKKAPTGKRKCKVKTWEKGLRLSPR